MTEQLKTLKDMKNIESFECETCNTKHNFIYFKSDNSLRKEAIKWIKELERINKQYNSRGENVIVLSLYDKINGNKSKIEWIKHFFNLTEEDLK